MKFIKYQLKDTPDGKLALFDAIEPRQIGDFIYCMVPDGFDMNQDGFNIVELTEADFPFTPSELYERKVQSGYNAGDFVLDLSPDARNQFTAQTVLLGLADYTGSVTIADINGVLHSVSYNEYKTLMLGYGQYYQNIWAASKINSGSI